MPEEYELPRRDAAAHQDVVADPEAVAVRRAGSDGAGGGAARVENADGTIADRVDLAFVGAAGGDRRPGGERPIGAGDVDVHADLQAATDGDVASIPQVRSRLPSWREIEVSVNAVIAP